MSHHVTVLVVDREPMQRAATAAALKELGFGVLEAGTLSEATEVVMRTANLTVVLVELDPDAGLARNLYHQVESVLGGRNGLFLVTADTLPKTLPRKLHAHFFTDREMAIYLRPLSWAGELGRLLREHLARLAV